MTTNARNCSDPVTQGYGSQPATVARLATVGYLYFVQCNGERGPVKIGYAKDVDQRLSNIRMSNPYPVAVIAHVHIEYPATIEEQLHSRFGNSNIRGEWFAWSPQLEDTCERVNEYRMARLTARLAGQPDPDPPAELTVVPFGETATIDLDVSADEQAAIDQARKVQYAIQADARERRATNMRVPYHDRAPRLSRAEVQSGAFVWRGKVRR
jgi:hypothetical protein